MKTKANQDLRAYASAARVYLWEIAETYGVTYVTLNNWMRYEFAEKDKAKFKEKVDKIATKGA